MKLLRRSADVFVVKLKCGICRRYETLATPVSIRRVGRSIILSSRYATWEEFWANTTPLDDDVVKAVLARNDNTVEDPKRASFDE